MLQRSFAKILSKKYIKHILKTVDNNRLLYNFNVLYNFDNHGNMMVIYQTELFIEVTVCMIIGSDNDYVRDGEIIEYLLEFHK